MNLETRWSEPALLSLAEVLQYTYEEYGERQYYKLRKQVMDAVRLLGAMPLMGAVEPYSDAVGVELRGYLVIPKIKIIYSVSNDVLYVEYVKNTYLSEQTMLERMGYCL